MEQEKSFPAPTGILCNLRAEPWGIGTEALHFSWIMHDSAPNARQSAYQILLASTKEKAEHTVGDVYDSGKILSSQSVDVEYKGPTLEKQRAYYLSVRLWNGEGVVSAWSAPVKLITEADDTPMPSVWHDGDARFVFFRRTIAAYLVTGKLTEAFIYVTARETADIRQYVCKLYVEGKLIGVAPTRSAEKLPYHTYDILPYLKKNKKNVIGGICCSGADNRCFSFRVVLCYADGTRKIIASDSKVMTWCGDACFGMEGRFTGYYAMGNEHIRAGLYPKDFSLAEFEDSDWTPARVLGEIDAQSRTPLPMDHLKLLPITPLAYTQKGDHLVFDMGKEVIGILRIHFSSVQEETALRVRLGEQKNEDGTPRYQAATGVTYDEEWLLPKGYGGTVENFGYRAFRYGEIVGLPTDVTAHVELFRLACPFNEKAASMKTTDMLLDSVWDLCKYTIEAATMDLYQDCPTRERGPYEGDAYIHQLSHYAVDRKYDVARYSLEYLYNHPTWCEEYKPLIVLSAWEDYMATGNKDSLAAHYDTLCQKAKVPDETGFVPVLSGNNRPILIDWPPSLRDGHMSFEDGIVHSTVASAFHGAAWLTLANIAQVLGKEEDQKTFLGYGETIKAALASIILPSGALAESPTCMEKKDPSAHASFYPVAFGLLEPKAAQKAMQYVLSRPPMPCNVYGAHFLLTALYEQGFAKEAMALLTSKETNSWYHMLFSLGATTAAEAWDFSLKPNMTMCHAWGSAPLPIAARYIAGVSPVKPGYEVFKVQPRPSGLKEFHLCVPTIRGGVYVDWFQTDAGCQLTVTVPANATAIIGVPKEGKETICVTVDGEKQEGTKEGDRLFFEVASGIHFICW